MSFGLLRFISLSRALCNTAHTPLGRFNGPRCCRSLCLPEHARGPPDDPSVKRTIKPGTAKSAGGDVKTLMCVYWKRPSVLLPRPEDRTRTDTTFYRVFQCALFGYTRGHRESSHSELSFVGNAQRSFTGFGGTFVVLHKAPRAAFSDARVSYNRPFWNKRITVCGLPLRVVDHTMSALILNVPVPPALAGERERLNVESMESRLICQGGHRSSGRRDKDFVSIDGVLSYCSMIIRPTQQSSKGPCSRQGYGLWISWSRSTFYVNGCPTRSPTRFPIKGGVSGISNPYQILPFMLGRIRIALPLFLRTFTP